MAITSPFKKLSHSRENSRDESPTPSSPVNPQGLRKSSSRTNTTVPQRSGSAPNNGQGLHKKSNTISSVKSTSSVNSQALAQQYESDKSRLIKYCFSKHEPDGSLTESYITHVRLIEDSAFPSSRPPSNSPSQNKKSRILALAVLKDGSVRLHKGRENANGSFQIGRTWPISDLSKITRDQSVDTGLTVNLGKDYYWETNSPKERTVFVTSLVRIYRKFTKGYLPILVNWDLSLFGLDEEQYKGFIDKRWLEKKPSVSGPAPGPIQQPPSSRSSASKQTPSPSVQQQLQQQQQKRPPQPQQAPISKPQDPPQGQQQGRRAPAASTAPRSMISEVVPNNTQAQPTPTPQSPKRTTNPGEYKSLSPPKREYPSFAEKKQQYVPSDEKSSTSTPAIPPHMNTRPSAQSSNDSIPPLDSRRPSVQNSRRPSEQSSYSRKQSEHQIIPPTQQLQPGHDIKSSKRLSTSETVENEITEQLESMTIADPAKSSQIAPSLHPSSASSGSSTAKKSIRDVEIVAQRRSLIEFEKEQEEDDDYDEEDDDDDDDDDITGLYQDAYEEYQSSPEKAKRSSTAVLERDANLDRELEAEQEPEPFPSKEITPEESYENSFDTMENSQEHLTVMGTPATITHHSDGEYDDLNELPDTPHLSLPKARTRGRSDTVDSAISATIPGLDDSESSSFDDIFDEINWETMDDSDALTAKLMKELADTEYQTSKNLIDLKSKSSSLGQYTAKISEECEKLSPLLNFFAVELSGFVSDIQHVEMESQGLQVETTNKKNLWNDLQELLNTVSVDEKSLGFLLNANIDSDLPNLEGILADLQSAIVAIRGSDKFEEDLGDMGALKDRRNKYENVLHQFFYKIKQDLDYRFQYTVRKMGKNEDNSYVMDQLSKLMVYSGLTLFTKEVSSESFFELVTVYEGSANPFYKNLFINYNTELVKNLQQTERFSLTNSNAYSRAGTMKQSRSQAPDKQDLLRQRFGLTNDDTTSSQLAKVSDSKNALILKTLETVQKVVASQQDFLLRFFHFTSEGLTLDAYAKKNPIENRPQLLNESFTDVDFDRTSAKDIYNSMSNIFQPSCDELVKAVVLLLRDNQRLAPFVVSYLEVFKNKVGATNQEFLASVFKKLGDRLRADWLKFVDNQIKIVDKSTLAHHQSREVSIVVKNLASFIDEAELSLNELSNGQLDISGLEMRSILFKSYEALVTAILRNLETDHGSKTMARFRLHEAGDEEAKLIHTVNIIQNSNWLLESIAPYKFEPLDKPISSLKNMFGSAKDQYVSTLVQENFGKIASFVTDVESLINDTTAKSVDPSKRHAYNKATLNKILAGYTQIEVGKIVNHLRELVLSHFSDNSSDIQKQLIEKIWSSLQAQFVSITIRLQTITEKYYKDIEPRFSKRDIIAFFNSARI